MAKEKQTAEKTAGGIEMPEYAKRGYACGEDDPGWTALMETLYLLSIPGMKESIMEGREQPVEDCATELDW